MSRTIWIYQNFHKTLASLWIEYYILLARAATAGHVHCTFCWCVNLPRIVCRLRLSLDKCLPLQFWFLHSIQVALESSVFHNAWFVHTLLSAYVLCICMQCSHNITLRMIVAMSSERIHVPCIWFAFSMSHGLQSACSLRSPWACPLACSCVSNHCICIGDCI